MQFTEHRSRAQGLADLLLYDSLINDGVMLLQDGALMAAWSFRGPDMASATHGEMAALSARLNSVLKLGTGWMIQCDAIRSRAPEYPGPGAFPDPITTLIDEERRQLHENGTKAAAMSPSEALCGAVVVVQLVYFDFRRGRGHQRRPDSQRQTGESHHKDKGRGWLPTPAHRGTCDVPARLAPSISFQ
jgi:hypothetical protein